MYEKRALRAEYVGLSELREVRALVAALSADYLRINRAVRSGPRKHGGDAQTQNVIPQSTIFNR